MRRFTIPPVQLQIALLALASIACSEGGTDPDAPGVRAVEVVSGLDVPVHASSPDGDPRLFVVEQPGRIRVVRDGAILPEPFLDISHKVLKGVDQGLFSIAFDPDYATTGLFYVNYTDVDGDTRVERYQVSADPDVADAASALLVLAVDQPYDTHNGGHMVFGSDGMLYIAMGDGGSDGDPLGHGQALSTLLGALLRIDVGTTPYAIPPDNPYVGVDGARAEIWAHGLRNPWRFSFDPADDMLYIADVGQSEWEEINAVPAGMPAVNYGWDIMEGGHCYFADSCDSSGMTFPVHEYSHAEGCSVTGGHVYRGDAMSHVRGHYFYSDFCSGFVRSFRVTGGAAADHRDWEIGDLGNVTSFGLDAEGELYVLTLDGTVYRLEPE